jgi:hypothetical protein
VAFQKKGSWYADWRDESGTRKRKKFSTRLAAQKYESRMKHQVKRKKSQRETPSRKP